MNTTTQTLAREGPTRASHYEDLFAVLAEDVDNALEHAKAIHVEAGIVADVANKRTKMYYHREWGSRRDDSFGGLVGAEVFERLFQIYNHKPSNEFQQGSAAPNEKFSTFGFGSKAILSFYRYCFYVLRAAPREAGRCANTPRTSIIVKPLCTAS